MKRSAFKKGMKRPPWRDPHKKHRPPPLVPKRLGVRLVPKDEAPIRDRAHMARVAEQRCLICQMPHPQAHHIRECFPRTTGVRIGDDKTVPLCVTHHAELHTMNNAKFWARYRIDPVKWAGEFYLETLAMRGHWNR